VKIQRIRKKKGLLFHRFKKNQKKYNRIIGQKFSSKKVPAGSTQKQSPFNIHRAGLTLLKTIQKLKKAKGLPV
jgi:hypothetical protein